jgi:hypothetical protein
MAEKRRGSSIVVALPDVITAGIFVGAWIAAPWFGADAIMAMMQSMLIEPLLLFAVWFFCGVLWKDEGPSTPPRRIALGGFIVLLYPILVLNFPYKSLVSAETFAWLVVNRLAGIWLQATNGSQGRQLALQWILAVVSYLLLMAFTAALIYLPRLGVTPELIATLQDRVGGVWADRPQIFMAFCVSYFVLQALVKFLQAYYANQPEASWLAPLPGPDRMQKLADDSEGSAGAAKRLAQSGYTRSQIAHELREWRGLDAVAADRLAAAATGTSGDER